MDREAWQAADHGVAAWTGLSVGVGQDLVTEQQWTIAYTEHN